MKKFFVLCVWLCIICIPNGNGQGGSTQEQALRLFSEGKYAEALTKFKKLLTLFPKDPKYFYHTGVCMVETNTELDDAIKNLTYASTYTVPRDVYFYIGKAYHFQYKFNDALSNYQKFKNFGDKKLIEEFQTDLLIAMAKNGLNISSQASIKVFAKDTIKADLVHEYFNRHLKNGAFREKPEHWLNMWISGKEKFYSFIPFFAPVGLSIYTSSAGSFKRNKDVYTIKKLSDTQWSKPEKLGASINSAYDEDFVYFNEAEATLYFSSKGHNSIGGYDIFKSVYNPDYKSWSAPVNLGYPVNSPYDDYLFVPDDSLKMARFVSNRETSGKKAIVYQIEYQKEYSYSPIGSNFEFKNTLDIINPGNTGQKTTENKSSQNIDSTKLSKTDAATKNNGGLTTPAPKNNYPAALLEQTGYNKTLDKALRYQLRSDSINREIEDKRELLNTEQNEQAKNKLRSEIWVLDKQAKTTQARADSLYTKAREYEHKGSARKDSTALTDEMARNALKSEKTNPEKQIPKKEQNTSSPKKTIVYEFKVMAHSPYKTIEEIPMDQPLPSGVIYRIQMGAFSKPIEPNHFKGIVPISGENLKNGEIKKYYAGMFSRLGDAEKALNKIKEYGFKDAYIVSYYDSKSVPTNRAKELEKE